MHWELEKLNQDSVRGQRIYVCIAINKCICIIQKYIYKYPYLSLLPKSGHWSQHPRFPIVPPNISFLPCLAYQMNLSIFSLTNSYCISTMCIFIYMQRAITLHLHYLNITIMTMLFTDAEKVSHLLALCL